MTGGGPNRTRPRSPSRKTVRTSDGGGTGIGSVDDAPPANGMTDDETPEEMTDFDFADVWEKVDADDSDVSEADYPVLRALDRAAQLETR